jgi:hypothetical protein
MDDAESFRCEEDDAVSLEEGELLQEVVNNKNKMGNESNRFLVFIVGCF